MCRFRELFAAVAVMTLCIDSTFAGNSPLPVTLKPVSGDGAGSGQRAFLMRPVGRTQTVSYFENTNGACELSLFVAEAFNGQDVPNGTTVRFEARIEPGKTTVFDTDAGSGLRFNCYSGAQSMDVSPVAHHYAVLR